MTRIAILGAGISGLATGYFLKQCYPRAELKIFEKNSRVGGLLDTLRSGGNLFELGARGLRPAGKGRVALEFVKEIGLWDQIVCANQAAQGRYLYLDGQLKKVPATALAALRSRVTRGLLKAIWRDLRLKPASRDEESVTDFVTRHFGTQK